MGDNLITLGYNIVHKSPKALPDSYTNKLTLLINKFLEKNPSSRPKISEMWDYFPQKVKGGARSNFLFSEPNENVQPSIVNRIELHNVNSAKLLKVEDFDKKSYDKALGSPLKKSTGPTSNIRPTTAGVSRIVTKDSQDKLGLNLIDARAGNASPTRLAIPAKESYRGKSPKRTSSQGDNIGVDMNPASRREMDDQKNPLTEKRHQDTESTVENKPRTFQVILSFIEDLFIFFLGNCCSKYTRK